MIKSQTMNNFMFDWPCGGDVGFNRKKWGDIQE